MLSHGWRQRCYHWVGSQLSSSSGVLVPSVDDKDVDWDDDLDLNDDDMSEEEVNIINWKVCFEFYSVCTKQVDVCAGIVFVSARNVQCEHTLLSKCNL